MRRALALMVLCACGGLVSPEPPPSAQAVHDSLMPVLTQHCGQNACTVGVANGVSIMVCNIHKECIAL